MSYKSRIPEIAAELATQAGRVAQKAAERIAEDARSSAPDQPPYGKGLKSDIQARTGEIKYGGRARFASVAYQYGYRTPTSRGVVSDAAFGVFAPWYWYLPEFGTAHSGSQPFMIPAVEKVRGEINSIARQEMSRL